jgi:hypothetical protein
LIQGSIQPPPVVLSRADFEKAMITASEKKFGVAWQHFSPSKNFITLAESLVREKFSQENFNRKR